MVKLLALISSAASAIADSLEVTSDTNIAGVLQSRHSTDATNLHKNP
jgi:hypothetical protein